MKEVYSNLLKAGWTMTDIDEMDILRYFEVVAYGAAPKKEKEWFIDDVNI